MASSADASSSTATNTNPNDGSAKERRRKRRWGAATAETPPSAAATATPTATATKVVAPVDSKAKALALKASIAARLAALKSKTKIPAVAVSNNNNNNNKRPLPSTAASSSVAAPPVAKRAKVYELDMTVTGPTFEKSVSKPKPKTNPYLAHLQETAESDVHDSNNNNSGNNSSKSKQSDDVPGIPIADPSENKYVDARLEAAGHDSSLIDRKHRRRELRFIEPGTFVEIAERKRQRAANAESAGFASGRKAGKYFRSATIGSAKGGGSNYYGTTEVIDDVEDKGILAPRAEIGGAALDGNANSDLKAMPVVVEWWDMELLPSKLKKQVSTYERNALSKAAQSQMQQFLGASTPLSTTTKNTDGDTMGNGEEAAADTTATGTDTQAEPVDERAVELRRNCSEQASLSYSKTATLIQHIVPIPPPGDTGKKPAEPVLYLTKKERKRARKRRREEKQRELQDLQAAGLIEAPKPRLTLQNFIRVMGDQAYVDPSQMERKVMEQVQKRQIAHLERNAAKKLTKEQRSEKARGKVSKDAAASSNVTGAIHVALFYVKNASHPYHRTKLDLNAQQLSITGGVIECDFPNVSCVICEGGPKAIQKYQRLMLVRMKWRGPDDGEIESDEEEEEEAPVEGEESKPKKTRFDKENRCELVWSGLATKRQFKGFVFQHCETSAQTRKILKSKGVAQYWDQVLAHASGSGDSIHLKLVDSDDESEEGNDNSPPIDMDTAA